MFLALPRNIYIIYNITYKNMYMLNWFETNDGKLMIPFHVHHDTAVTRESWIGLWIYRGRRGAILDQGFCRFVIF